mmetsp:Transcript_9744/g.14490  ORF Transcript_9744/g.14490 Transcript_9744/m.14490 type:complete len:315 (+) Transcript_9744:67-1011(+)
MPPNTPPNNSQRNKAPGLAQTYGKYESSETQKQLWLARLPPKLAALWDEAPEGTLLGHLTFTKGAPMPKKQKANNNNSVGVNKGMADAKPPAVRAPPSKTKPIQQKLAIQVNQDLVTEEQSDLPLDYTLTNITTKIPHFIPFSREQNGKIQLHGTVSRSCNLQMERTQRYREMCKSRLLNAVAGEKRFVKPVQNAELVRSNNVGSIGSGFGNSIASFGKKMMEAKNERDIYGVAGQKRKFDDTQPIRSILFELFSQQNYWSVKEMIAASGRSEKEIRADLKQIAESKRTGEFKGLWELKSEFAGGLQTNNGSSS